MGMMSETQSDSRTTRKSQGDSPKKTNGSSLLTKIRSFFGHRPADQSLRDTLEVYLEESASELNTTSEGERDERAMLANILRLRELTADDVMLPRADIVALSSEASLDDLIEIASKEQHSRLPIYKESLDDVIGMVHVKDVLTSFRRQNDFSIEDIIREILFVAPSMAVSDLLLKMRLTRTHMALVVDEYGGIDGLVTIEDLVEQIVGEIEDEHDIDDDPELTEVAPGEWVTEARMKIEDLEAMTSAILTDEEREEDIDTLGGLVFTIAGRVPGRGEVVTHSSGIDFKVLEADPRRIKRLRLSKLPSPPTDMDDEL
jgi:magnesium and cobalt transporter